MEIDEMHIDFNVKFQNLGTQSYNRLQARYIDWLINDQTFKYLDEVYAVLAKPESKTANISSIIYDNLAGLIQWQEKDVTAVTDKIYNIEYKLDVPNVHRVLYNSMYCTSIFKDRTFNNIPIRITEYGEYANAITDYHTTSIYNSPLGYKRGDIITVSAESARQWMDFRITNIKYEVILKPQLVSLSENISSPLLSAIHPDLIDNAVRFAKVLIDNNRLDEVVNQPINME